MKQPTVIGPELLPAIEPVMDALNGLDPVTQMKVLEILSLRLALKFGERKQAEFCADSMHKHIKQMMQQFWQFPDAQWAPLADAPAAPGNLDANHRLMALLAGLNRRDR
jgi:hypothetical protein